jgi:hypothetical protein
VALARKLAVLLHRMLVDSTTFVPRRAFLARKKAVEKLGA